MRWLPFGSRHRSQHGPLMVTAIPALCGHVGHVRHRRPTSPPVVHYSLTVSAPGVQSWFRPLTRHRRTRWTDASPSGSAAGGCITGTFRLSQRLMTSNASLTSRSPQGAASKSTSGRPLCPLLGRQAGRGHPPRPPHLRSGGSSRPAHPVAARFCRRLHFSGSFACSQRGLEEGRIATAVVDPRLLVRPGEFATNALCRSGRALGSTSHCAPA